MYISQREGYRYSASACNASENTETDVYDGSASGRSVTAIRARASSLATTTLSRSRKRTLSRWSGSPYTYLSRGVASLRESLVPPAFSQRTYHKCVMSVRICSDF